MKNWIPVVGWLLMISLFCSTKSFAAGISDFAGTYHVDNCTLSVDGLKTDPDATCSSKEIRVEAIGTNELRISYILPGNKFYYQESLTAHDIRSEKKRDSARFEFTDTSTQWTRNYRNEANYHNLDEIRKFIIDTATPGKILFINITGDVFSSKYKVARYDFELVKQ